jgi:hypothetical protein
MLCHTSLRFCVVSSLALYAWRGIFALTKPLHCVRTWPLQGPVIERGVSTKVWKSSIARISVGSISSHHGLRKDWSKEREVVPEKAFVWGGGGDVGKLPQARTEVTLGNSALNAAACPWCEGDGCSSS